MRALAGIDDRVVGIVTHAMRADDVARAVVVIAHAAIGEVTSATNSVLRELLRAHLLVNLRADVRCHSKAFHRVRIKSVLNLWPRNTKAVGVVWFAGFAIDIERDAVFLQRRLIEHTSDAKLARE